MATTNSRGVLINAAASAGARVVEAREVLGRCPTGPHRIADRVKLEARLASAEADRVAADAALRSCESGKIDRSILRACARHAYTLISAFRVALGESDRRPFDALPLDRQAGWDRAVEALLTGRCRTPEEQHKAGMAVRLSEGWKLGLDDPKQKTSPWLRPWEEIPPEQKAKDVIFHEAVRGMAETLGVDAKREVW